MAAVTRRFPRQDPGLGRAVPSSDHVRPVGTKLTLLFQVPGGFVQAEAVVRNVSPSEGTGVEFTGVGPHRLLLDDLLKRLLQ